MSVKLSPECTGQNYTHEKCPGIVHDEVTNEVFECGCLCHVPLKKHLRLLTSSTVEIARNDEDVQEVHDREGRE